MPTIEWKHIKKAKCPHVKELQEFEMSMRSKCEECEADEDLRVCMSCGYVACCESSKAHNTAHFNDTEHPIIKPYRCDYDWLWCYKCNAFLD